MKHFSLTPPAHDVHIINRIDLAPYDAPEEHLLLTKKTSGELKMRFKFLIIRDVVYQGDMQIM